MNHPFGQALNGTQKRIEDIEREPAGRSPDHRFIVSGGAASPPAAGAVTNTCRPRHDCNLVEVTVELDPACTADTTVEALRDGTVVASVTVPAGMDEATIRVDDSGFGRMSKLRYRLATVGTGWSTITVHGVFATNKPWHWSGTLVFGGAAAPTSVALSDPFGEDDGWTGVADLGTMTLPAGSVTINITGTAEDAPLTQPLECAYELDGPDTIADITAFSFTGDDTTVVVADPQTLTGGSYDVKIAFRVGGGTGVNIGTVVDFTFSVT